ncbi:NUDIX domain-containing protein [Nesterenkonia sp. MY13]|uniref:NUDIX domain-containing protein n=1 Tax=Nesterenkonia sedimenti TaxID=1463632 RepID=A0A7X8TII1_9MICC|nr:NUDIX domain-containing protein [Nesterenkonia sedimenti]NLS09229.1 NUDIX domain-containing protein [Nesterenkonia sedimenti]
MSQVVDRFQVIPAAYVLLVDESGRVLLTFRRGTGYMDEHWAFGAAGHVEADESVCQAAVREAQEELGVVISEEDLEPLTVMHRTRGNGQAIDERVDFFFTVRQWQGLPQIQEPDKAVDLIWAEPAALPQPLVPHESYVLDQWLRGTLKPIEAYGFTSWS